jgi:hypothetical protein
MESEIANLHVRMQDSEEGEKEGEGNREKGRRGQQEKQKRMGGRKGESYYEERKRREGRASPVCLLHHNPLARDVSFVVDSKTRQAPSPSHPTVPNLDLAIVPCLRLAQFDCALNTKRHPRE